MPQKTYKPRSLPMKKKLNAYFVVGSPTSSSNYIRARRRKTFTHSINCIYLAFHIKCLLFAKRFFKLFSDVMFKRGWTFCGVESGAMTLTTPSSTLFVLLLWCVSISAPRLIIAYYKRVFHYNLESTNWFDVRVFDQPFGRK